VLFYYTLFHVALSLVGIASGFVVIYGMLKNQRLDRWTALFLVTTVATSVTGFGFPFEKLLPSHIFGVISLALLAVTIAARYRFQMVGPWRLAYVVTALLAQYLDVFVLVVQAFLKIPALHALAPNQNEPPFAIAQGIVLVAFIVLGILAAKRFRPA
jgi:hypothetical protein